MDISGAGTAIMLAVAAGLWFLYLVPTWVRQREYLATERTATRLQQTMRVLAETAELPDSVRIAATARDAARAERLLRAQQRRMDAVVARQVRLERAAPPVAMPTLAARRATTVTSRTANHDPATANALLRQRMRRTRRIASLVMVASSLVAVVQIYLISTAGAVAGSWVVLGAAFVGGAAAIGTQRRLDARAMPRPARREAPQRVRTASTDHRPVFVPAAPAPWTPVPVPQPLYVSRPQRQQLAPAPHAETLRRQAAAQAEEAARATRPPAEIVRIEQAAIVAVERPAAASQVSRFASMGLVDPNAAESMDIDEMMRRRRSAG
ncbi:hypothetical protein BH11ACT3_BH11ACT3_26700 [soil metagenome]